MVAAAFGMGGDAPGGRDPSEEERDGMTGGGKCCWCGCGLMLGGCSSRGGTTSQ